MDASKVKSGQYQHIQRTAQTMGERAEEGEGKDGSSSKLPVRRLSEEGEAPPGTKLQLAPTALAASRYGVETVSGDP